MTGGVTGAGDPSPNADSGHNDARETRPSGRVKYSLLLVLLALSGFAMISWTQDWFTAAVTVQPGTVEPTAVDGQSAAPAIMALGISGLALAAALAIAGRLFRVVLGVLTTLIGLCIALSAFLAIIDPVTASEPAVTAVTGIAGHDSVAALINGAEQTAWPVLALAAGLGIGAAGVAVCATSRRWPGSSRRYRAPRLERDDRVSEHDAVDSWDDLSRGDDPTV
ncbi:hypothetical protein GCM10027416_20440 [Okibacterium endophyticum]